MGDAKDQSLKQPEHGDEVTMIFVNMGADPVQAKTMAAQLLKRARQIADERDTTELEALETLLKQVIEARNGV